MSLIVRQSNMGTITWNLDSGHRKSFREIKRHVKKLLRQNGPSIQRATGELFVLDIEAGIRVLGQITARDSICTTEQQTHQALAGCYFAAHFGAGTVKPQILLEVMSVVAQVAPCIIRPFPLYLSATIVKKLSMDAGSVYADLADATLDGICFKLTLAQALCLLPELCLHGGRQSESLVSELDVVTEAYRDAVAKLERYP